MNYQVNNIRIRNIKRIISKRLSLLERRLNIFLDNQYCLIFVGTNKVKYCTTVRRQNVLIKKQVTKRMVVHVLLI